MNPIDLDDGLGPRVARLNERVANVSFYVVLACFVLLILLVYLPGGGFAQAATQVLLYVLVLVAMAHIVFLLAAAVFVWLKR